MFKVLSFSYTSAGSRTTNPEVHEPTEYSSHPSLQHPMLLAQEERSHPSWERNDAVFLFCRWDNQLHRPRG